MAQKHGWQRPLTSLPWPDKSNCGAPATKSQQNVASALDQLGIEVSFNSFLGDYEIKVPGQNRRRLDDKALRALRFDIERLGLNLHKDYFCDAVLNLADQNSHNVCLDYLNGPQWDGTSRIDGLLTNYCGADDNEFNRTVGRKFMVAAVRRVKKPGTKFDHLLILEGDQGVGKSSFARILAGVDWFTDCVRLGDDPKIIAEQTPGKLIAEIPELVGLSKKEIEQVKSMVTRTTDIARMAYDRSTSEFPRHFVFMGTTNAEQYLNDKTGNRRFWPVKVQKTIDQAALANDRDQLWAEAVYRESHDEDLFLTAHLEADATKAQKLRQLVDANEERLKELVSEKYGVVPKEEFFAALGLDGYRTSSRRPYHDQLIDSLMQTEGWTKDRLRQPKSAYPFGDNSDNRRKVFVRNAPHAISCLGASPTPSAATPGHARRGRRPRNLHKYCRSRCSNAFANLFLLRFPFRQE